MILHLIEQVGFIPCDYARCYKELGDVIRSCYGNPILPTHRLTSDNSLEYILVFDSSPVTVDRSVIQEDQTYGQVICGYTIDVQLANTTDNYRWIIVAQDTSIGNEKVDIWLKRPLVINVVRLKPSYSQAGSFSTLPGISVAITTEALKMCV